MLVTVKSLAIVLVVARAPGGRPARRRAAGGPGLRGPLRHARPVAGAGRRPSRCREGAQRPANRAARVRCGRHGVGQHRQRRRPATRSGSTAPGTAARRWEGLLGKASIPEHVDRHPHAHVQHLRPVAPPPRGHPRLRRRGRGRLHRLGSPEVCAGALCDGADAGHAVGDAQPVPDDHAVAIGRFGLHFDNRGLAWAHPGQRPRRRRGLAGPLVGRGRVLAGRLVARTESVPPARHRHAPRCSTPATRAACFTAARSGPAAARSRARTAAARRGHARPPTGPTRPPTR